MIGLHDGRLSVTVGSTGARFFQHDPRKLLCNGSVSATPLPTSTTINIFCSEGFCKSCRKSSARCTTNNHQVATPAPVLPPQVAPKPSDEEFSWDVAPLVMPDRTHFLDLLDPAWQVWAQAVLVKNFDVVVMFLSPHCVPCK